MIRLDGAFLAALAEAAPTLHQQLLRARGQAPENVSQLILELAPHLEDFLAELFGITAELRSLQRRHTELAPLFALKRRFVFKKAASGMTPEKAALARWPRLSPSNSRRCSTSPSREASFVEHVSRWLDDEACP